MTYPSIYVASLSDYVAGRLHGEWIDLEDKTADDVHAEIAAMLAKSPERDAEEFAIHDTDGFDDLDIGEYESIETVIKLAELVNAHGAAFTSWYSSEERSSFDLDDLSAEFQDAYVGEYDDLSDYAYETFKDAQSDDTDLSEWPYSCIDWERAGRELELGGDVWTVSAGHGSIYVFRSV